MSEIYQMPQPIPPRGVDRLNTEQFHGYVRNIERSYKGLSKEDRDAGDRWYPEAAEVAERIGRGDRLAGAGLLAAYSPKKSWPENVRLAEKHVAHGIGSGHFKTEVAKANKIWDGEDPYKVLPLEKKTGHFFRNILNPEDEEPVTIDRHAHDVAVAGTRLGGEDRGLGSQGRYDLFHAAYQVAGHRLGVVPSAVQAAVWVPMARDAEQENRQPPAMRAEAIARRRAARGA